MRLMRRGGKREVQKLMDVIFDVSFRVPQLRPHVTTAEDCECLAAERTHDATSREKIQKKKLRGASKGPDASTVLDKKNTPHVLRKQMILTASVF